jgi:hypothetical protein
MKGKNLSYGGEIRFWEISNDKMLGLGTTRCREQLKLRGENIVELTVLLRRTPY